jgi:hypothetical protein
VLSLSVDPSVVEADLAAGRLCCPGCGGRLAGWGYARERTVRTLEASRSVRSRRAVCRDCETTHVLLPAWSVPRRRDSVEVIGDALLASAHGVGHRKIAGRLGRPPGTVRGWLRAFRARAPAIERCGRLWALTIDATLPSGRRAGSRLADAVNAVAVAGRAVRLQLGKRTSPWELAVVLTGGLLYGPVRAPPGHAIAT